MKKTSMIAFGLFLFGILVLASGCQKSERFQTAFPLEADEVTRLLVQVGLPGEISEKETQSRQNGSISYVIRDAAETYGDCGNSKMVANVVSLARRDGRALSTIFDQSVADEPILWADWERQIKLATLLYGGFEDEEALYKACIEAELPSGSNSFRWETELSEGYCRVYYEPRRNKTYDERGYELVTYSAMLRVDIYESRDLYENMNADNPS